MKILIDDREKDDKVIDALKELGEKNKFEVEIAHLEVGDYGCAGKNICIERKSISDMWSSITSQHIFEQAKNMATNYEERYLIISGQFQQLLTDPNFTYPPNVHVYLGAIASLAAKYGLCVISVESSKQMAYIIYKLCEKSGESPDLVLVKRLAASTESLKISALTASKGISQQRAEQIYSKFGSLRAVCDASIDDLMEIDGIGKVLASNIKEVFY